MHLIVRCNDSIICLCSVENEIRSIINHCKIIYSLIFLVFLHFFFNSDRELNYTLRLFFSFSFFFLFLLCYSLITWISRKSGSNRSSEIYKQQPDKIRSKNIRKKLILFISFVLQHDFRISQLLTFQKKIEEKNIFCICFFLFLFDELIK